MNEKIIASVEKKEAIFRGYKLLKEDVIKCANCKRKLLDIIKVKDVDITQEITAKCPCGDASFLYRVTGEIYFKAVNNMCIGNIDTDIEDNMIKQIVEVIKDE